MTPEEFFEKMYLEKSRAMFQIAMAIVHNRDVAQEMVNESFLALWTHIQAVMRHGNPTRWLYMVLRRRSIDEARLIKLRAEVPLEHADTGGVEDELFSFPLLLPAGLTSEEKQLLIWRYEQGLEYSEIAENLSISVAACRMRVKRARERCAKLLCSKNI